MLLLLRRLFRENKTMSLLVQPLRRYAHSEEMNFEVADKAAVIERLNRSYGSYATYTSNLDGIRLEFRDPRSPSHDWWFNVRASNTESLLRLNVEARTVDELKHHIDELTDKIRQAS